MEITTDIRRNPLLSLRSKVTIVVLSILLASSVTIWVLSVISYRAGMSRAAARLQGYRTDHIQDFVDSQIDLLDYLDLQGDPTYEDLAVDSIRAYAFGMLRNPSELVIAVRGDGTIAFAAGQLSTGDAEPVGAHLAERLFAGEASWMTIDLLEANYMGSSFVVPELDLAFFVGTDSDEFYREQRQLTWQNAIALVLLGSAAGTVVALLIRRMLAPLSEVAQAMREIAVTKDFSRRVTVKHPDEIGMLAAEFNRMTRELGTAYSRLKEVAETEKLLRREVTEREHETLELMGRATEYKDPETARHIVRVGIYAALIARAMGENEEQQDLIRHAAPLHDIGKLGIPDSILLKPGPLSPQEYRRMEEHTLIAYEILRLSKSKYLQAGAVIALTHHEHYDGCGYPYGTRGEEIPLFGRIVGLVDVFDALISRRPYKDPWQMEAALAEIRSERGKRFDPRVVDAFESVTGDVAEVVSRYQDDYS